MCTGTRGGNASQYAPVLVEGIPPAYSSTHGEILPTRCQVAGDCVARLLWVYTVRLAGESNKSTEAKLKLISDALFPSGSRHVFPRHVSSQFFVRVVSCMAQGHFEFAIKLIISFLGGENSHNSKNLLNSADRAVIGIRSFLVSIAATSIT